MNDGQEIISNFWELYNKLLLLNNIKMKEKLSDYTSTEIHCIDFIEKNKDVNVSKLASQFYMTRGAITKLTKKLIIKNLIQSYQKENNKKEIYFKLTNEGKEISKIHNKIHNDFIKRDKTFFENMTDSEIETVEKFSQSYIKHLDNELKKIEINTNNPNYNFDKK